MSAPYATVTEITPDMARDWLTRNHENRPIGARRVHYLATAIARGEYMLTGEAIKFDTEGYLLDGQHRLAAIIEANQPIRSLVVRDIDTAARRVMDTGKTRTLGDVAVMEGITGGADLVTVARTSLALRLAVDRSDLADYITRTGLLDFIAKNAGELRVAYRRGTALARNAGGATKGVHAGIIYDIARVHGEQAAGHYVTQVAYGAVDSPTPYIALRSWLLKTTLNRTRRSLAEIGHAATIALEDVIEGRERTAMRAAAPWRYLTADLDDLPKSSTP
jgi:hypothetical protein